MARRLEMDVDGLYGAPRLDTLGRQLVTGLLAMAFLGAVLVSLVTTEQDGLSAAATTGTEGLPAAAALAEAGGLGMAMENVVTLSSQVEGARVRGDGAAVTSVEAKLEDAWSTLAVVHERMATQAEVAEGERLPLMGARPPAPYAAGREEALVRSAMAYVRGAVETRDVVALERARALLEMARR